MNQPEKHVAHNTFNQPQQISDIELRVVRQLLEALLFEGIVDYHYEDGLFTFALSDIDYQAYGYIAGFSRIRLNANSIKHHHRHRWLSPSISDVIQALPASVAVLQKLQGELEQTVKLCQFNALHMLQADSRRQLSYHELESALHEGHPYHPCFKARTGFTLEDHQRYGPEMANPFQLHWLAVRREYLQQQLRTDNDREFWQQELGLPCFKLLQQRLSNKKGNWQDYGLLPIHPWQWHNLQQGPLATALQQRDIITLGTAGDYYQASISVRTLINISHPQKAHIKLPMNMVNTSSLRTIESHSVCSAPLISTWLKDIVESDPFFTNHAKITLLDEYAGILVQDSFQQQAEAAKMENSDSQPLNWRQALDGHLAVIFRQSLDHVAEDHHVIPFTALMSMEKDGQAFIHPWLDKYARNIWLTQLIDVAVIPIWHLLVHHGIALEAHGQNMLLIHRDGWPVEIVLRDFHESVEYVEDYLADPCKVPDFKQLNPCYVHGEDNQYYWMTELEALRELLIDTLFVFNLSEIANLLEREYNYLESDFWQLIDNRLQQYAQGDHTSAQRIAKIDIHQPFIQAEALMQKKLSAQNSGEFHHLIANPLAPMSRPSTN